MPDFDAMFGPRNRETRYGSMTQEQYESRRADEVLRDAALTVCTLCDSDGYRPNGRVCDHIDRTAIAERGSARVRQALQKVRRDA